MKKTLEERIDNYLTRYVSLIEIHDSNEEREVLENELEIGVPVGLAAFSLSREDTEKSYALFNNAFNPNINYKEKLRHSRVDNFAIKTTKVASRRDSLANEENVEIANILEISSSEISRNLAKMIAQNGLTRKSSIDKETAGESFAYAVNEAIKQNILSPKLRPNSNFSLIDNSIVSPALTLGGYAWRKKKWLLAALGAAGVAGTFMYCSQGASTAAPFVYTIF